MTSAEFSYMESIGYTGSIADKRNAYYNDLLTNGGDPNRAASGIYIPNDRSLYQNTAAITSGTMRCTYFTPGKTTSVTGITQWTGSTAAGATPTLCKYGLFAVNADGSLTLLSDTPNDTALFAATDTAYRKALTTPQILLPGRRYAVGTLVVTAAALPTLTSVVPSTSVSIATVLASAPRLTSSFVAADVPASVAAGSLSFSNRYYAYLVD